MTTFYYEPPSVHQDKGFKGDVSAAYAWGTQVVEIEVDTDTGFIKLLKVTGAHDVGRVLNRLGIEGQIEGGVVMGQGYAFTEDLMIEDGVMKNPNFRDYKLVTAPEIPEMDIAFIESMDGEGPQGAKGVGEAPSICMAAAAGQRHRQCHRRAHVRAALHAGKGLSRLAKGQAPKQALLETMESRIAHEAPHVLSMEQALSLPYATLRFAQLGWRVIRIESTPTGEGLPGDPNRYIGGGRRRRPAQLFHRAQRRQGSDRAQPQGPQGPGGAARLITELDVDVFCCNTVPKRYKQLGIDYESLAAVKPDLIWAGISAMGPDYPDAPGYDPVIQAMAGYMELTGPADGPPTLSGVPLIDLKAGDEVYAGVMMALLERAETGKGSASTSRCCRPPPPG
jgi:hypothetical protein